MLMIPGPSQPDPEVLKALSEPVLPHYGAEWKGIYGDTTSRLKKVFGTRNDVVLMPVPGQVAVETSVVNLVGRGGTGFVCLNGVFSGMIPKMIRAVGGRAVAIRSELGSGPLPDQVAEALDAQRHPGGIGVERGAEQPHPDRAHRARHRRRASCDAAHLAPSAVPTVIPTRSDPDPDDQVPDAPGASMCRATSSLASLKQSVTALVLATLPAESQCPR